MRADRSRCRALLLTALLAACGGAVAQHAAAPPVQPGACPPAPPPFRFLRFDEDFAAMRHPACRSGSWDALKHIDFDDAGRVALTLGGDARVQLVEARYLSFGNEGGDNHGVTLQRYHLHASLRLPHRVRLFAELKSNHQSGREPGPLAVDVDRLDVHQAFVDFGAASSALLRVGRQELLYGSGRRIFPRNGSNVRGSFDAVLGTTRSGDWRADAFVLRPVAVDAGKFDDSTMDTQTIAGVYATGPIAAIAPARLDLYILHLHRDEARFQQGVATERRHTVGVRAFARDQAWDHDHEASWQWGRFGAGSIRAWALTGETGYTWREGRLRPRASLRFSAASGDRDAAQPDLQTFNSLFPRGGAVDEGFNVSAANTTHARAALSLLLLPAVEATLSLNTHWRTSRRDGVYGAGSGVIRAAGASRARHVGESIDVIVIWAINRHATFDVTAGFFASGRFVAESGTDRNMSFVKPTLSLRF